MEWNPKPPLKCELARSLLGAWISTSAASDVEDHLLGGFGAGPQLGPGLGPSLAKGVEHGVVDVMQGPPPGGGEDATSPNRAGWSRSAARSDTHSPPPATMTATWASNRPRS